MATLSDNTLIPSHYNNSFKLKYVSGNIVNRLCGYDMVYSVLFLNAIKYLNKTKNDIKYTYITYYSVEDIEFNFYIDNEFFVLDMGVDLAGNCSYYYYRRSDRLELLGDDIPITDISSNILCNIINNRLLT